VPKSLFHGKLLLSLALLSGCAVRRPVAQPLAEARYFHAEDALSTASDRIARTILDKLPADGPIVVALSPVFLERQVRIVRSLLFAGLAEGRDIRLVPHAAAHGPGNARYPVVEIVLLAAGSELLADPLPPGVHASATMHVEVLVLVHEHGKLLWSEILHEEEPELPIESGKP
jgi:hypothetical protein